MKKLEKKELRELYEKPEAAFGDLEKEAVLLCVP